MSIDNIYKATLLQVKIFMLFISVSVSVDAQVNTKKEIALKNIIQEENFISINGIEQWVTIHGDSTKPIVLFIHGGPGSPMSPYSNTLYKNWEKDFIIVQWDQRGAGKTYGSNAPEELTPRYLEANPLTLEQMTEDGIELSEYLLKHLRKQKLILFGTSWGSALGVKMATKQPILFYAYVGHSQIVDTGIDLALYNKVYQRAKKINDTASLATLNSIGKPPYDKAKYVGRLMRIVKKYERAKSTPAPASWFVEDAAYDNPKDNQNRSDGDDYSFVNFAGDKQLGVKSMSAKIDLLKDNVDFKMPVYLIQGSEDLLTPKEKTKKYFDNIKAPGKKYFLLPKTAHGFNRAVVETQYKIFKAIKI
ncbi:MAG: alpha/beta hydrolase [Ferruginibacter sp.]